MAEKQLEIFLITPDATEREKYKYQGMANMVILRCRTGDMGILPGRVACSAILDEGILRILGDETERRIAVLGGVFHFENDVLTLISQKALLPSEIDINAVEAQIRENEARKSSETNITAKDKIRAELSRLKLLLDVAVQTK